MTIAGYTAVRTEGGLLPPDLLARVAATDAELPGLRPEDYGLAPGERVGDAVVRSWTRLNGVWQLFADKLDAAPATETTFETQTRQQWLVPLLQELGFGQPTVAEQVVIDDKTYPVSHQAAGVAIHLLGARVDLERRPAHGVRPAHGMMQEFLNRNPDQLWGVVTNGMRLRLLRDSSSLTRQAFCEFDLEAIFRGQQYAEFALCWLVSHATRFAGEPPSTCFLERWSNQARTDGTRALDQLRGGVEAAITALGNGFLADPANDELRRRLRDGELAVEEFQHQLLRLVYRLLFLLVAEARGLMAAPGSGPEAIERYRRFYSVTRIADLARRQRGTAHGDLWDSLRVVFGALAGPGLPALGLYGMGSFLWSDKSLVDLGAADLPNRALVEAIGRLTTVTEHGRGTRSVRRAVDYRNLGAEELGSIYESLLELHPTFDGTIFGLATAAGNERKTTGSYYTPTPLIRVLLDSALDPVLDEAEQSADPERALLDLKVLDPAAGSGHFLIAAAHRIAHRLASARSGESEPAPDELRHALREVVGRCIYGIDVNPMAVELCKVGLWMEATEPGRPLGFLDHRIVCGNSLLGTTPALLAAGVPDEAFKPLTGDEKAWVTTLKKRNRAERNQREQGTLDFGPTVADYMGALAKEIAELDAISDDRVEAITAKEERFAKIQQSDAVARAKFAADALCSAFVALKTPDNPIITDEIVRRCTVAPHKVSSETRLAIEALGVRYRFLHLHVAFPEVFHVPADWRQADGSATGWAGGFDAVLGNPPWDQIQYDPQETFAVTHPEIAKAPTMAKRNRLIAKLSQDEPESYAKYLSDVRSLEGVKHFVHAANRYPLGSVGRLNTAPLFVELMWTSINKSGRVGVVAPTGIATDSFTQGFFNAMVDRRALISLFDFENRLGVFPAVDSRMKFSLLTLSGDASELDAEFVFFALQPGDLEDSEKRFTLSPADFALLNPNTRTCPVFRTRRDAEITKGIYRRVPVLLDENRTDGNPWGFKGQLMFMMNTDSHLFRTRDELEAGGWILKGNRFVRDRDEYLPLREAKMLHHFDHRWATFDGIEIREATRLEKESPQFVTMPKYWVPAAEVRRRSDGRAWVSGWRDIASNTNERTFITSISPMAGFGNKFPLVRSTASALDEALLSAVGSSFVADFIARQKIAVATLNFFFVKQFALPSPEIIETLNSYDRHVLELTYTAWDLAGFAADLGYHGSPFRWDEERRRLLRAEFDARVCRLYGLERDDADYVLDTFPILKRKDEVEFGEYRTKRLILERFDAMAEAQATGRVYQTVLDPPPADPSCAHSESTRPSWASVSE